MNVFVADLLPVLTAAAAIVGIFGTLLGWRRSVSRRAAELEVAAKALAAHYSAINFLIQEPALPVESLEALVFVMEGVNDEDFVRDFVDEMLLEPPHKRVHTATAKLPKWAADVEALRATRPDIADAYRTAMGSGMVGAILRWRSTAPKFYQFVAMVAEGDRRETIIADRVTHRRKDHHTPPSGVAIPA